MKKYLFITFLSLGILAKGRGQIAALHSNDPAAVVNAFITSVAEKNTGNLQSLVTHDFTIISWDGQSVDSQLLSQGLQEGVVNLSNSNASALRTRSYGDAAVVTGNWKISGDIEGNRFDNTMVFTGVVVKQGGALKLASFHMTPVQ